MLSELDCSCGRTSPTVRSTSTPLIMRKHLRVVGRGVRVSRTSLAGESWLVIGFFFASVLQIGAPGDIDLALCDRWSFGGIELELRFSREGY